MVSLIRDVKVMSTLNFLSFCDVRVGPSSSTLGWLGEPLLVSASGSKKTLSRSFLMSDEFREDGVVEGDRIDALGAAIAPLRTAFGRVDSSIT